MILLFPSNFVYYLLMNELYFNNYKANLFPSVDCVIGSTKLQQGKSLKLEGSAVPQSVDVVFILDNTWQCSTTFPNIRNVLSTVSKSIEGALKSASLDNNKYAVVGFGIGAPYSPEVISVNGSIFGNRQTVDVALNHTHFAGGHHHHFSQLIDVATELRFRDGVGKVFVVVPCGEPSDVDEEYSELVDKLSEMDIILHVISLHKPTLSDTAKVQPDDIIGKPLQLFITLETYNSFAKHSRV